MSALVSELSKRNGRTIAEHARDRGPGRTLRLLNRAAWGTLAAMAEIRRFAAAALDEAPRLRGRRAGRMRAGRPQRRAARRGRTHPRYPR